MARAVLMSLIELLGDLSRCVLRRATRGRPECPFLADCVAKLFWASERERMIQGRQSRRNIDSNAHPPRFIYFKMQFHRPFSATFATQSAGRRHSVGLSAHYSVAAAWRNVMVPSAKLRRQFHATRCTDIRVFDRPRFGVP